MVLKLSEAQRKLPRVISRLLNLFELRFSGLSAFTRCNCCHARLHVLLLWLLACPLAANLGAYVSSRPAPSLGWWPHAKKDKIAHRKSLFAQVASSTEI